MQITSSFVVPASFPIVNVIVRHASTATVHISEDFWCRVLESVCPSYSMASLLCGDCFALSVFAFPRPLSLSTPAFTNGKCFPANSAFIHVAAMLIHPDRQRFEQIRARWEAAQQSEDEVANMVGRRISQQPTSREAPRDGSNKFRRTISQGLAFISNPLSQRKTTPGRQTAHRTSVAVTAATINTCAPSSPRHTERSTTETGPPNKADSNTTNLQPDATPKTVPRSRTLSFLPRPVDPTLRAMPSKIPAPSPPPQGRRVSSPRQYILHHAPLQERHVVVKQECRERCATSPSKVVVRSRTTPSLHKAADPPQLAHSKNPKPAGYKALGAMPVAPKHTLQENISANKRSSQQLPQILEKTPRHESLATPTPLRSNTEKDLHRKILGTPNGLGGMWRSSRALAAANHEVKSHRVHLPLSFSWL